MNISILLLFQSRILKNRNKQAIQNIKKHCAQLGAPAVWVLPVAFPMVMAFGGMLALVGFGIPGVEFGIAASAVVLGAMVAAAGRPRLWIATLLVGFFAIFHGHAHGTELPEGSSSVLYSVGFVVAFAFPLAE